MFDNVPVARILGFLALVSPGLLGWITVDGYRASAGALGAGAHIRFALFGMVVILFTYTMTLFYFVGTGSRIKKVVREYGLDPGLADRTRIFKARCFPWLTFTPLVTMAAFILGGGAHTRVLPGWVHGGLSILALGMSLATMVASLRSIGENVALIDAIDEALPEGAGE